MNIEFNLLLIKEVDKTFDVKYCEYINGKCNVTFSNGKVYSYHSDNIKWMRKPKSLDPKITVVSYNNQTISNIAKILSFENQYTRLILNNGNQKAFLTNELDIEQNCIFEKKTDNCLSYLKKLSTLVSIPNENSENGFLTKQYEQITQIKPSSIFSLFLDPKPIKACTNFKQPIFPFGFNLSQKEACRNAANNQISIIEGPPGTGKTQTILNIIANAIMENKTVAVVSNNNSATANVLTKLQNYDVDFIAAYLGNNENKERFFAEQNPSYPNMNEWKLNDQAVADMKKQLEEQGQKIDEMLAAKNRAGILKQELSEILTENEYFNAYENETNEHPIIYKSIYRQKSSVIMKFWLEYRRIIEESIAVSTTRKLKYLLRFGIYDFKFYNNSEDRIISLFQKLFYDCRISELNQEIDSLTIKLDNFCFEQVLQKYAESSMRLFKAHLEKRFSKTQRVVFPKEILYRDSITFLKEYPIILSTTHSIKRCASPNYQFDYLIMDESTQVDLVTGALALFCAKKAVIVGDLKQLPNVVPEDIKEVTDRIFNSYQLPESYRYSSNSILSSLLAIFPEIPKTMLKEHYRCHPKIIGFCNKKYYNNALVILTKDKGEENPLVLYKTSAGNHARGNYNQRQIDIIFNEIITDQRVVDSKNSIGIISPYRMQTEELQRMLGDSEIEADTVHKFQGREKDIIILSTVANEINDFVDNPNLLNVAVSRAAKKLIVIASSGIVESDSNIGDLIRYIRYNNFEIIESKTYSVFDFLYRSYSQQLLKYMSNNKTGTEMPSEVLLNGLLEKVLKKDEFNHFDKTLHQPLKMLIRDSVLLNESERKFAMNVNTHTDFLIFNKFDKSPVLVVEVDGYAYHAANPKQLARDKIKDTILQKYSIPILRLPTNGSREEEKLCQKLSEIGNN